MGGEEENRGFKGLGRLAANQPPPTPPTGPVPPPVPAGSNPPPPTPPAAAPKPPGAPGPSGGVQWTPPPTPAGGGSGCLKVGLILVGILLLGLVLLAALGRTFAPAPPEPAYDDIAPDPYQAAAEAAADEALAAEMARQAEEDTRLAACRADAGTWPESGEVLVRTLDAGGHTLRVNAGASDGLIKLRRDGRTALAFYVRANETAAVTDIPDGTYQVLFAGGSEFSRGCGEFTSGMSVSADPDPLVFELTHDGDASYFAIMEYTLTRQAGGNFEPEVVDPDLFRD